MSGTVHALPFLIRGQDGFKLLLHPRNIARLRGAFYLFFAR